MTTSTAADTARIKTMCRRLRLSGIAAGWTELEWHDDTARFLEDLLALEIRSRDEHHVNRLLKQAGFRQLKTLADFERGNDLRLPPGVSWEYLTELQFLDARENLFFTGNVGTGKTHLATALGVRACQRGRETRFFTAASLADTLLARQKDNTLPEFMAQLLKAELIIIDEIGFVPVRREAAGLLYQVVADCYETRSLIVTGTVEFAQWGEIFGDERLTTAIVDRLIHHSRVVVFSGSSYRLARSTSRQCPETGAAVAF